MIAVGRSWVGPVRSRNEDVALVRPERNLLAVCDGVGGAAAGHIAARLAMDEVRDSLYGTALTADKFVAAVVRANEAVFQRSQAIAEYEGMGTTLVAVGVTDNHATFCHVGDSRGYRLRGETLEQITKDHSVLQEAIDAGEITAEAAWNRAPLGAITRAIGPSMVVTPEITTCNVESSDTILLCSDGLSDFVSHRRIESVLRDSSDDLQGALSTLMNDACDAGSTDNITIVLGRIT